MNKPELGQVFTDKTIADYMVSLFSLEKQKAILDPCFGGAVFIDSLLQNGYTNLSGCELDSELYDKARARFKNVSLENGDFLKFLPIEKYDGIIMNPPYIRQERIDDLTRYGISKKILMCNPIFKKLPKTANLYMYFVIKAVSILKENGEMVVIFPSSWLDARNGTNFKHFLFSECDVVNQIHVHGEVFEKDAIVDVVILKVINRKSTNKTVSEYISVESGKFHILEKKAESISLDFCIPFSSYGTVRRGMTTGYNEFFINPNTKADVSNYLYPILSSPKDYTGFSTQEAKYDHLLLIRSTDKITEDLKQYISEYEHIILANQKPKTLYEKIKGGSNWYILNNFDSKGIIFSYFVRREMKFSYNPLDIAIRDNFYVITPNIDLFLMFSLLNNYYTYYQLEKAGKKYGAGLLKIQRYDIENLSFPDISLFSNEDVGYLKLCAKTIIENNNNSLIHDITRVISKYSKVSYEQIFSVYTLTRNARLENI